MSSLRRRKVPVLPPSLKLQQAAAAGATSGSDSRGAAGKAAVRAPSSGDWLVDNQWGLVPLLLTLGAAFTRYYRLDQPPGVVFGEGWGGYAAGVRGDRWAARARAQGRSSAGKSRG